MVTMSDKKYFTSQIVVQVTHQADSIDYADLLAQELKERLANYLMGVELEPGHNAVNVFVLSIGEDNYNEVG